MLFVVFFPHWFYKSYDICMNAFVQSKRWRKLHVAVRTRFISKNFIISCFYFLIWKEPNMFGLGCLTDCPRGENALKAINTFLFSISVASHPSAMQYCAWQSSFSHKWIRPFPEVHGSADFLTSLTWLLVYSLISRNKSVHTENNFMIKIKISICKFYLNL